MALLSLQRHQMALSQIFFFIILFFGLLCFQPSTSSCIRRISCGDQWIRFPFSLSDQHDRCGYPRFNLSCKDQTKTILSLPFAGDFIVENINYHYSSIWINDPDYCTPRRLLKGLNLSGTPFKLVSPESYVFLNCPIDAISKQLPDVRYISCLSDETSTVVSIPLKSVDIYRPLLLGCRMRGQVLVPDWDPNYSMRLTWNEPDCMSCETSGGSCMFKSDTGLDIQCSGGFSSGYISRTAQFGIIFGVGIPLLCILGIVLHLRMKANNHHQHHNLEIFGSIIVPRRLVVDDAKGLDGPSIEAYPVTLIGESRGFLSPGDNTCSICLCEYQANEKLRTIPDCKHYFHAICIDEWLKINVACPLCRNTPDKSYPTVPSSSS